MKTIQIPEDVFCALCRCHLYDMQTAADLKLIRQALQNKLDAVARRTLYTQSKTAPTEEEREKARQQYLDHIGMPADFRYEKHTTF